MTSNNSHAATSALPLARPHGKAARFVVESLQPFTRRQVEIRLMLGDALQARAATPSGPSLLRVSGMAGIAIAFFCIIYFAGQLLRAVLA